MSTASPPDSMRRSLRNIVLLSAVQALGSSNQSIVMTVAALTAISMAPDPALVTLPVTAMIVGLALSTSTATMLIYRLGRTRGFMLGGALGIPAALLALIAVVIGNFYLFCAALFLVGSAAAAFQQIRFAAADSVPAELKSRAISWVMAGGVVAGFLGPQLGGLSRGWFPGADYAASYLMIGVLSVLSILILSQTRLAPVVRPQKGADAGRSLGQLLRTPSVFVPMVTAAVSYALMTLVMVAAPVAMVHVCGHPPEAAASAIQWHVVAMFAPSFVTGSIIKHLGAPLVTAIGLALIIAAAGTALMGTDIIHFDIALILLGLGWNFGFIGSTTLLTAAYRPEEAARVQAVNEQVVFGTMAVASIGSGVLLKAIGWQAINTAAIPVAGLGILLLALLAFRGRGAQPAATR